MLVVVVVGPPEPGQLVSALDTVASTRPEGKVSVNAIVNVPVTAVGFDKRIDSVDVRPGPIASGVKSFTTLMLAGVTWNVAVIEFELGPTLVVNEPAGMVLA